MPQSSKRLISDTLRLGSQSVSPSNTESLYSRAAASAVRNRCAVWTYRCENTEMGIGGRRSGGVDYPRLARSYTERSSFNEKAFELSRKSDTYVPLYTHDTFPDPPSTTVHVHVSIRMMIISSPSKQYGVFPDSPVLCLLSSVHNGNNRLGPRTIT
ncbi:uncharacterized protein ASPGLDRAFT_1259263 [Aspergillus glaucus CBS 516.65]|uniref:Uncharacterized protein n=1 Tax=Aspergillus glaucus CBS 516.65 TaxID=1160497 RepID=A0A1L9VS26_ASPGL|nr:hypothetical protein ASPGLDRAFT_1259263 [Aspergillus glaucus CBS 516.65]OJJ86694.1 hypothetical protein ASPGLDRAFT_1259263 [Aspergillus glaucus CBS 516.65]